MKSFNKLRKRVPNNEGGPLEEVSQETGGVGEEKNVAKIVKSNVTSFVGESFNDETGSPKKEKTQAVKHEQVEKDKVQPVKKGKVEREKVQTIKDGSSSLKNKKAVDKIPKEQAYRFKDLSFEPKPWKESEKKTIAPRNVNSSAGSKRAVRQEGNNIMGLWFLAPVFLMIFIGAFYIYKLAKTPPLNEKNISTFEESVESVVYQYGPLHPFEMCSMRKPDLIAQLGEPMGEGEGVDDETKYLRYEYEWFGFPTKSKIYYGREQRIYKAVINFNTVEFEKLQNTITEGLGEPLSIEEGQEFKDIIWIKDSIKYWLTKTDEGVNQLEVRLAYYTNPNDYDMGYRPTTIQETNKIDITGDGKPDDIMLIGSRSSYTETAYSKLFLLVSSNNEEYFESFPKDLDGGIYPQMEVEGTGKDAKVIVTTDNTYVMNKNVFTFSEGDIKNIESVNAPLKK